MTSLVKSDSSGNTQSPRIAVLGIGNEFNADDAAGVLVLRGLSARLAPQPHIRLLEAGLAPENFTGLLRKFQPDYVLMVDAAHMSEPPGTVLFINWRETEGLSATTHTLPPTVLGSYLTQELGCQIGLIGIQPANLEFDDPVTLPVQNSIEEIVRELAEILSGV